MSYVFTNYNLLSMIFPGYPPVFLQILKVSEFLYFIYVHFLPASLFFFLLLLNFRISHILTNTLYHLIFVKAGFTWLFIKKMRLIAMISVTFSQWFKIVTYSYKTWSFRLGLISSYFFIGIGIFKISLNYCKSQLIFTFINKSKNNFTII